MRRHADAGLRAIVDEDVALHQLATDVVRLRHVDRYRAAALFRIARCVDTPVAPIGQLDQPRGLTLRFPANRRDAGTGYDLQSRSRGFERRNARCPRHKTVRRIGISTKTGLKCKRVRAYEPSGERRRQKLTTALCVSQT